VRDTSPHEFPKFAGVRGGGGSHRIEMATEIQCTPPERQSSVFVTKKAEGARRALPLLPTSRVVRHARRTLACKLIEGAHGQRGQIISAGRRVLVEGLSQQVHVLDCASSMMARVSPFSATPHCLGGPTLLVRRRSGQLCATSQLRQTWHPLLGLRCTRMPGPGRLRVCSSSPPRESLSTMHPRLACAADADRVECAVALPRDRHGRAERGEEVQLVLAVTVLVVGVVAGFLQRGSRLVLLGAVVQAPSLGLARVGREREAGALPVSTSHDARMRGAIPRADFTCEQSGQPRSEAFEFTVCRS
jgi:hypothetical protein